MCLSLSRKVGEEILSHGPLGLKVSLIERRDIQVFSLRGVPGELGGMDLVRPLRHALRSPPTTQAQNLLNCHKTIRRFGKKGLTGSLHPFAGRLEDGLGVSQISISEVPQLYKRSHSLQIPYNFANFEISHP